MMADWLDRELAKLSQQLLIPMGYVNIPGIGSLTTPSFVAGISNFFFMRRLHWNVWRSARYTPPSPSFLDYVSFLVQFIVAYKFIFSLTFLYFSRHFLLSIPSTDYTYMQKMCVDTVLYMCTALLLYCAGYGQVLPSPGVSNWQVNKNNNQTTETRKTVSLLLPFSCLCLW